MNQEEFNFIYKEEFWYLSAFINSLKVDGQEIAKEIENDLKNYLQDLSGKEIQKKEIKEEILHLAKNISLSCEWIPYLEDFPYKDENSEKKYDTLGFFQFEIEYFRKDPSQKKKITPLLIQQIPFLILPRLRIYDNSEKNEGICLDLESPIYIFVTSDEIKGKNIEWTKENIYKYKKIIANWVVIYSGQWEDYSEELYERRVENNLSNRLSELHYIKRNSGFIYMAKQNYEMFFSSYMKKYVLGPTPRIRAIQFALRSINQSLDLLFLKIQAETLKNLKIIEREIQNLRLLRGLIQTKLSIMYNELDYNRREHYTKVLKHLLNEFEIANIVERINVKFNGIFDAIQDLYQKINKEMQQRTERGLIFLNLLFGAGILVDLISAIIATFNLQASDVGTRLLNGIVAIIIGCILITTIIFYARVRLVMKNRETNNEIIFIMEDLNDNIILSKRKYPPYQDYYELPNLHVEKQKHASRYAIKFLKENLKMNVISLEKMKIFKRKEEDPRGYAKSLLFKAKISIKDGRLINKVLEKYDLLAFPKENLRELSLAFDHGKILKDIEIIT